VDREDLLRLGLTAAQRLEQPAEVLVGTVAGGVAPQLAPPRVLRDRVPGIQREVGFVGAHLVSVMGEVGPAVRQHRLVRRVGQQPPADAVVHPAVREQQPVRRFMGEDVETHVTTRHQHEGEQVRPPGVDPRRCDHDAERLDAAHRRR
jgi:hypothetical protein